MYNKMVNPSQFVQGQAIEVIFLEDDKPRWYKGLVKGVDHYGEDNNGTYVECKVEYEDGEVVDDARFYDCDYDNDESLDSWRFSSSMNDVLESLNEIKNDIEELQNKTKRKNIPVLVKLAFFIATGVLLKAAYWYIKDNCNRCAIACEFENMILRTLR